MDGSGDDGACSFAGRIHDWLLSSLVAGLRCLRVAIRRAPTVSCIYHMQAPNDCRRLPRSPAVDYSVVDQSGMEGDELIQGPPQSHPSNPAMWQWDPDYPLQLFETYSGTTFPNAAYVASNTRRIN